jgi:hypothetical protein
MASRVIRRLVDLLDVSVSAPADGEVLTYDTATSKWRNEASAGGGGGSVVVLAETIMITNAQIKALPTTAITIVAAPGAGQALRPLQAYIVKDFTAGAYTGAVDNTNYPHLSVGLGDNELAPISDDPDTLNQLSSFLEAVPAAVDLPPSFTIVSGGGLHVLTSIRDVVLVEDLPIVVSMSNDSGGGPVNLGGGNAANTLSVTVLYTVVDL